MCIAECQRRAGASRFGLLRTGKQTGMRFRSLDTLEIITWCPLPASYQLRTLRGESLLRTGLRSRNTRFWKAACDPLTRREIVSCSSPIV